MNIGKSNDKGFNTGEALRVPFTFAVTLLNASTFCAYVRAILKTRDELISREQMWQLWGGIIMNAGLLMVTLLTCINFYSAGTAGKRPHSIIQYVASNLSVILCCVGYYLVPFFTVGPSLVIIRCAFLYDKVKKKP